MSGYIYAMQAGSFIKFGWAKDVEARRLQLQTGNPHKIEVVAAVAWPRKFERAIHAKLHPFNTCGEWFDLCDESSEVVRMMRDGESEALSEHIGLRVKKVRHETPSLSKAFFLKMLELDLPMSARRTLDALMAVSRGGVAQVTQSDLSASVGIAPSHVSAAITRLCAANLISRSGRGRYVFDPDLFR